MFGETIFLLWALFGNSHFFGAAVKMHGVGRGHGRSLLRRGKKSVNHFISLFEQMFMFIANLHPKDYKENSFFFLQKIKETAQSFLLTEKICCYTTICPETALILG